MDFSASELKPGIVASDGEEPRSPVSPSRRRSRTALVLAGILVLGAGIRASMLINPDACHVLDVQWFVEWTRALHEHKLVDFYKEVEFCDYPPLSLLMFRGVGAVVSLFDAKLADEDLLRRALKLPACLADLCIGLMLFFEARRLLGSQAGLGAAALYLLNPLVFYDSAYWGQVDSVHAAYLVAGLVLVNRRRWGWAGVALTLALTQKFQSIAVAPLLIFEVFRLGRWRGIARMLWPGVVTAALVGAPFAWHGMLDDVVRRGYVHVVGSYPKLSHSAYNVWYVLGIPDTSDNTPPEGILRLAANESPEMAANDSWLLYLTWRHIGLIAYSLTVAVILTVYSFRPGPINRFGAAGLLALAFFLVPTEMHERYALPAAAFLALWATTGAWRERAYFLLCAALLLNLTPFLSAEKIAGQIAGINAFCFLVILIWVAFSGRVIEVAADAPASIRGPLTASGPAGPTDSVALLPTPLSGPAFDRRVAVLAAVGHAPDPPVRRSLLILAFQVLTIVAVLAAIGGGAYVEYFRRRLPSVSGPPDAVFLSSLTPRRVRQDYKELKVDRSIEGGTLRLGDRYYLRGLGTHAPSTLVYDIPDGIETFEAVVGIDWAAGPDGSAKFVVELDEREIVTTPVLRADSQPAVIRIPVGSARRLTLRADPSPDGKTSDHVDWAYARFVRKSAPAPESLPASGPAETQPAGP